MSAKEIRKRIYLALEQGPVGNRLNLAVDRLLLILILINLVAVALESVPDLRTRYATLFMLIEYVSLLSSLSNTHCAFGARLSMDHLTI